MKLGTQSELALRVALPWYDHISIPIIKVACVGYQVPLGPQGIQCMRWSLPFLVTNGPTEPKVKLALLWVCLD